MYNRLNKKMIQKRISSDFSIENIFWNAEAFNLNEVTLFNELNNEQQIGLLEAMSQEIIEESIFIERSAMDFASMMSLSCETDEQQESYALMNSDEIEHYFMLKRFMTRDLSPIESNKFMGVLNGVMETKSKPIMVFFGQVLLEGLSISFYRNLIETCQNKDLADTVKRIYMDEASHHSIGVSTIQTDLQVSQVEKNKLYDFVAAYVKLQHTLFPRIINSIGESLGGISKAQKNQMFEQMNASQKVQESLDKVKGLLRFDLSSGFIEKLENSNLLVAPKRFAEV